MWVEFDLLSTLLCFKSLFPPVPSSFLVRRNYTKRRGLSASTGIKSITATHKTWQIYKYPLSKQAKKKKNAYWSFNLPMLG